jgi:hypothetical protein
MGWRGVVEPDYQYFLERSRLGGVGSQVLQVQVYLKEIVRSGSGFGSGSRVGEKKRKRSDSSGESENDEDDSDEDAEDEEPVQRVTKSVSNKLAGRDGKREPVVQSASTNPSPAQKNKMDQPFSSTPSSSSLTDPTTSDPDSPSPAPRRNIIHLGSRFKPAKPSPLGGTVVARSPTASIGTNGSDGEDEDVVMEDVVAAVPPSPAVAGKKREEEDEKADDRPTCLVRPRWFRTRNFRVRGHVALDDHKCIVFFIIISRRPRHECPSGRGHG